MTHDEFLNRLEAREPQLPDERIRKAWGRAIGQQRKVVGVSRRQLAESVGVSVQAVAAWENGKSAPRPQYQVAIAKTLGVSHDILFRIAA